MDAERLREMRLRCETPTTGAWATQYQRDVRDLLDEVEAWHRAVPEAFAACQAAVALGEGVRNMREQIKSLRGTACRYMKEAERLRRELELAHGED